MKPVRASQTLQQEREACRHLGLAEDSTTHFLTPTERHRCYLWQEGVRTDLNLQDRYCLSSMHTNCPWVSFTRQEPWVLWRALVAGMSTISFLQSAAHDGVNRLLELTKPLLFQLGGTLKGAQAAMVASAVRAGCGLKQLWESTKRGLPVGRAQSEVPVINNTVPAALLTILRRLWEFLAFRLSHLALWLWKDRANSARALLPSRSRLVIVQAEPKAQAWPATDQVLIPVRSDGGPDSPGDNGAAHIAPVAAANPEFNREQVGPGEAGDLVQGSGAAHLAAGYLAAELQGLGSGDVGDNTLVAASNTAFSESSSVQIDQAEADTDQTLSKYVILERGVVALDEQREDTARAFFVLATELHPDCFEAWLWRSRTAIDLPELIVCLEKALTIDPGNGKAKADLDWARQRYQQEQRRLERQTARPSRAGDHAANSLARIVGRVVSYVAGSAAALLGMLWLAAGIIPLLGPDFALTQYEQTRILPILDLPDVPASGLGVYQLTYQLIGFVPDFNLLALVPLILGGALLLVADGLASGKRGSAAWLLVMIGGATVCVYQFSASQEALYVSSTLSAIVVLGAVAGILLGWNGRERSQDQEVKSVS